VRSFSVGDRVSQGNYGHGTVTSVNEYHTRIDFDSAGPRTFLTNQVVLEASSIPAPVKAKRAKRAPKAAKAATTTPA
jgi:hypothetical protein